MEISPERKEKINKGLRIALIVFLAVIVANCFFNFNGYNKENKPENVISLSGHGEVTASPDIANINFTIMKDASTVKEAEDSVSQIEAKTLALLKGDNVAIKDIKTESVSFNPKYSYQYNTDVTCGALNCRPQPGKSVIIGYEASENITVKIRKVDDVGKIVQGLGTLGVTDLNGPNFTIDNPDLLKAQAQKLAIDDAKAKAQVLAKNLGVRLGKITSFSDNGNYPMPMYATAKMDSASGVSVSAPAVVPTGENLITSDVTITYEIK